MKRTLLSLGLMVALAGCQNQSADKEQSTENNQAQQQQSSQQAQAGSNPAQRQRRNTKTMSVEELLDRAKNQLEDKEDQAALFTLREVMAKDSLNAEALLLMGKSRMQINRSKKARNTWQKCIKVHPENVPCRLALARLFYTVKNFEKALKQINEVIDIDKYEAEAYFLKGLVVRDKHEDTTLALRYLQQATDMKQDYVEALDVMGVMLTDKGDTLAPYYFKRILENHPKRSDIYYKLGVYYMKQDKLNKAIEAYTKATEINPQDDNSYYNLGFMFVELKEYGTARDYFAKAINASDKNYKAYYGRGYAYEMLGDVINAKEDYKKALEILPKYTPAREGLQRVRQ